MSLVDLASSVAQHLAGQGRLVRLPNDRTIVFVGDTHGDTDATERVLERHLRPDRTVVFLGDVVDRGPDSIGNLRRILEAKLDRPRSVHLLMGNHEAWKAAPFSPADFWAELDSASLSIVGDALSRLPYAAWHPSGVLGLHGALPDETDLGTFDSIELGSDRWRAIAWGDWSEGAATGGLSESLGRPVFGRAAFETRSARLGIRVLVRSHQPSAPTYLFDDRCLTIFTSSAYGVGPRSIALLHPGRAIRNARDLEIRMIE